MDNKLENNVVETKKERIFRTKEVVFIGIIAFLTGAIVTTAGFTIAKKHQPNNMGGVPNGIHRQLDSQSSNGEMQGGHGHKRDGNIDHRDFNNEQKPDQSQSNQNQQQSNQGQLDPKQQQSNQQQEQSQPTQPQSSNSSQG